MFESDLAVDLEGLAIGQPRDNVLETFSFDILKQVIHFVREVFGLPFHCCSVGVVAAVVVLEGLLVSIDFLRAVRSSFE